MIPSPGISSPNSPILQERWCGGRKKTMRHAVSDLFRPPATSRSRRPGKAPSSAAMARTPRCPDRNERKAGVTSVEVAVALGFWSLLDFKKRIFFCDKQITGSPGSVVLKLVCSRVPKPVSMGWVYCNRQPKMMTK